MSASTLLVIVMAALAATALGFTATKCYNSNMTSIDCKSDKYMCSKMWGPMYDGVIRTCVAVAVEGTPVHLIPVSSIFACLVSPAGVKNRR